MPANTRLQPVTEESVDQKRGSTLTMRDLLGLGIFFIVVTIFVQIVTEPSMFRLIDTHNYVFNGPFYFKLFLEICVLIIFHTLRQRNKEAEDRIVEANFLRSHLPSLIGPTLVNQVLARIEGMPRYNTDYAVKLAVEEAMRAQEERLPKILEQMLERLREFVDKEEKTATQIPTYEEDPAKCEGHNVWIDLQDDFTPPFAAKVTEVIQHPSAEERWLLTIEPLTRSDGSIFDGDQISWPKGKRIPVIEHREDKLFDID